MGLREKVALMILINTLLQVSFRFCSAEDQLPSKNESDRRKRTRNVDTVTNPPIVVNIRPQVRASMTKNKIPSDRNQEALQKTFNFPDVEYPTASTPRPPFYLQETNILQRNPLQRAADYPPPTAVQNPRNGNKNDVLKGYNYKQKQPWLKTTKPPEAKFSEYSATPQPYYFRQEGAFPDVEYPLNARDTWKPNYWHQIPVNRFQNDINKNAQDNSPNIYPTTKSSKSQSKDIFGTGKKSVSKLTQAMPPSTNQNNVNNNYRQVNIKEEPGKNHFIKTELQAPIFNERNNYQETTPSPSTSTQSTSPFALTPYTTVYFDSTPPSINENNYSNNENKKVRKKKKLRKKSGSSSIKPSIIDENCSPLITLTTPMPKIHENYSYDQKDITQLETPEIECTNVNISEVDTSPYKLNNAILPITSTTPSCLNNETTSITVHSDDKTTKTSNDNTVASNSNGIETVSNIDKAEGSSYLNDNIVIDDKSSMLDNKAIEFPSSWREDAIVVPTDEEEYTTDSIPDFDEDVLSMYSLSTSTLSPFETSPIDKTWSESEVLEFLSDSLINPDELDQFYIMVP